MSYLGYPRLHFSGSFMADPSTINNTPNNYTDAKDQAQDLELYWNPNGTGMFDLKECVVTKVVYGPGDDTTDPKVDPLIGQTVAAVYTKAPPKIVDLDPDQQNVSEVWGMTIQVGGPGANPGSIADHVRGNYLAGPFNAIWAQALHGPPSSASGSGVYQSTLTGVVWNTRASPGSRFLRELEQASQQTLSFNFVVNAHNNVPPTFSFNDVTFEAMAADDIPREIIAKLQPMRKYLQNVGHTPGDVPTKSYVNFELNRLLGQQDAGRYTAKILETTTQPYKPATECSFPFGLVTGTLGPRSPDEPIYYTACRTLAPTQNGNTPCYFAPFDVRDGEKDGTLVTLNLGNSLPTNKPGYDIAMDVLGPLTLVYFDQAKAPVISIDNAVTFARLPADMETELRLSAGILEVAIDDSLLPTGIDGETAAKHISTMPLGLVGEPQPATKKIWLAENLQGYNLRADKFLYRMNPGVPSSDEQPIGETAELRLYVTKFGAPVAGVELKLHKFSQAEALQYTNSTLGTGGTRGIKNLSIPAEALTLTDTSNSANSSATEDISVKTGTDGIARVTLQAADPGTPRADQNVDGQVYFVGYGFADNAIAMNYTQDKNDLVSVMVYSQFPIPEAPTWHNCIKHILPQYQKLYPIMGRFQLGDYQSVVENAAAISHVLSLPMQDPLHMPVSRDLSIERKQAILDWIASGTPEGDPPQTTAG